MILPAAIMLAAVGGAFATQMSKTTLILEDGAYFDSAVEECIKPSPEVKCQPDPTSTSCTWFDGTTTHNLKRYVNQTECGIQLFKPE
ncbi:DUF6520 family protein [Elizabethkingia anophelis]|uniref:DUF6520 family protein n=1 Tax=Elizabethkingia anophelis TaxID=1117645 RepID=UPI00136F0734|nr:DUF6520 family protein [Elizabethkingia anophelis]MYY43977.1 hypothetical protein [Elizabethkingia anophelis]